MRRFLERNKLLTDCDNGTFAKHMNQEEWFGYAKEKNKSCVANEMNTYNFLPQSSETWTGYSIPINSRATESGIKRLYQVYHELEDNKMELYR